MRNYLKIVVFLLALSYLSGNIRNLTDETNLAIAVPSRIQLLVEATILLYLFNTILLISLVLAVMLMFFNLSYAAWNPGEHKSSPDDEMIFYNALDDEGNEIVQIMNRDGTSDRHAIPFCDNLRVYFACFAFIMQNMHRFLAFNPLSKKI